MSADRLDEVIDASALALDRGARAYWVCPLVEESEKIDLAAAEERAVMLKKALGVEGRPGAWPDEGGRARCRDGGVQGRRDAGCWSPPP